MQELSLDEKNIKILSMLDKSIKTSVIWQELLITRFNLAQHIKTLIKYGYLKKTGRATYEPTQKGYQALMDNSRGVAAQLNIPTKRAHALGLKYPLKDELLPSFKPYALALKLELPASPIELHNNSQAIWHVGVTAKLTNKSLILYAPELYYSRGQPSIVVEARAKALLDREALKLEHNMAKYASFKLIRINAGALNQDALLSEIITEEIADEGHPLASASSLQGKPSKIVLARHPYDKKERLKIDGSKMRVKGVKELELPRVESAGDDADVIDAQFNAILDGLLNLLDEQKKLQDAHIEIRKLKRVSISNHQDIGIIKELLNQLANTAEPRSEAGSRPRWN